MQQYVMWYFLYAVPCFFLIFCNGVYLNSRMTEDLTFEKGLLYFCQMYFRSGFRLFLHDHGGVYCPWSWTRARKVRLADMKMRLGATGEHHNVLRHITATDCDDPEKQERIARYTFISRKKFWYIAIRNFLIAPIGGTIVIILMVVALLRAR